ncbi:MAG: type I polyketide synthase, partial [Ignavibacteriae bacterium]|nr:type I polyketide synthase [Ignavibacteriota bacterium]
MSSETTGFEIAIVGMSGRFPGAKNVRELWENLCLGKNLISYFTDNDLKDSSIPEEFLSDSNYVKARGIIDNVDGFDANLFSFYPKEIEMLDPQQRLFLECSWEAMEDAGYAPDNYKGVVGVFGGIGMNTYIMEYLKVNPDLVTSAEGYQLSIGNDKDFLTTRVSYKLNLKGPSLDVQTACSTSLVATHLACMNLINYQCDLAIAGGSTIVLPQKSGYHYQEGMILSPDGVCRPFDKDAGGTVSGNGVGIVVLKRLEDAIEDRDDIYAVIKGSAFNNDGAVKVGYTAPGVNGQTEVITSAFEMADVPMSSIGYIETHGTGTALGDPIEIDALTNAFRHNTNENQFCAIGSVKSNLGHLDTAAGVTGLIKTALSIYNNRILPSINYSEPNPQIDFVNSPFYVNTQLKKWDNSKIRRASVSSFGIGGTNAHIVLEQAQVKEDETLSRNYRPILFSAKSKKSLEENRTNFINYLKGNKNNNLDNIAYTLQTGRKEFEKREFILATSNSDLLETLEKNISNKIFRNDGMISKNPPIVFMFSGQGSQYINMCKDLYSQNKIFKFYLDECFAKLTKINNFNLQEVIFPFTDNLDGSKEKLKRTENTQPALFSIEYSLAKTLIDYGIKPSSMVGHSIGEFVAACISGVLDLDSALRIISLRANLMQKVKKGLMLSIKLSESELLKILPNKLDLAVKNSQELCVVSGEIDEIRKFEEYLKENNIESTVLHTSHAFHSRMMEPILE